MIFSFLISLMALISAVSNGFAQQDSTTYQVQKGDTFLKIALDHHLTQEQLAAVNPEVDPAMIVVGTEIIIPPYQEEQYSAFLQDFYRQVLLVENAICYQNPDKSRYCLAELVNPSQQIVYNIQVLMILETASGTRLENMSAPFVNQVLPEESVPVQFYFSEPVADDFSISTSIQRLKFSDLQAYSLRTDDSLIQLGIQYSADQKIAEVVVTYAAALQEKRKTVLAGAYDQNGDLCAVRAISDFDENSKTLTLYSLGNPIEDIKVWSESY